ncbi:hypothetical protein [Pedobacter ureilyticus]|uniref:Lipoprotein n=1 Tax=Pedobacter ureilyticus TaxID=1393051 RepID=A0ABW9J6P8_9SPHI|nr:hypothetical protein [Pedobacter helvus]
MNNRFLILIFISATLVLFSCTYSNERKATVITDSLIKVTENIAIADTKFGMSEQQFNQLHPDSLVKLGERVYNITSYFNDAQKLNMIYLVDTTTIGNKKFDQALFNKMDLLKQYFVTTYGEPQHNRGYPKQEKMQNGKAFEAYKWEIGKKKIAVGIALEETNGGNIYYVLSHIDRKQ